MTDRQAPRQSPRTRLPSLGPRGEGWTSMQVVLMLAIPFAAWLASMRDVVETPEVAAARGVGAVALLSGLGVVVASLWYLGRGNALSALPRPLESGSLVESGPYRLIRHPIYSGLILACAGIALIRVSVLVAALTVALAVVLDLKRRREEAWLLDRYPEYAAYRTRTRALIPGVY